MTDAPKIIQDEFSITRGSATFRLVWTPPIDPDDKADLLEWLKLVERRIARLETPAPPAARDGEVQQFTAVAQTSNRTGCIGTPGMPVAMVPADATPGVKELGSQVKTAHTPMDSEPTK